MIIPYFQRRAFDMDGLQLLIEQQNEFEVYKSEKARQLEEHVNHLKYLITTEFLSTCPDFDHEIKEDNVLSFKYKELILLIQIVNPITEKRNEKEYNFAERATKRLKVKVTMKRKKEAHPEIFEILDVTQYKKNGPYTYKYDDKTTEDFLELLDLFFKYFVVKKVEFNQSEFTGGFGL